MAHPIDRPLDPTLTHAIETLVNSITHIVSNPIRRSPFHRHTRLVRHFLLKTHRNGLTIPQDLSDELDQYRSQTTRLRQQALALSEAERTATVPPGPYCYRVIRMVSPPEAGLLIEPCPFLMGSRPDTLCFLNTSKWWADLTYNPDACKGCGINESDEETPDAHRAPE